MRATTRRMIAILGLMAAMGAPAVARADDDDVPTGTPPAGGRATFYELTENMKLVQRTREGQTVGRRIATAALTGVATLYTPLCPVPEFQSGPAGCAVNVLGRSNISLLTGQGRLDGDFSTNIQGDNPVDGPEATVLRGDFQGHIDLSPAILHQIPFGTMTGRVNPRPGPRAFFTGVFRLPFAGHVEVPVGGGVTKTLREIFCPLSPKPNPYASMYGGVDLAYLDFDANNRPNGQCLDIQPHELSLGAPLVRLDITF